VLRRSGRRFLALNLLSVGINAKPCRHRRYLKSGAQLIGEPPSLILSAETTRIDYQPLAIADRAVRNSRLEENLATGDGEKVFAGVDIEILRD